jgi:cytidine deaminase
MSEVDCEQLALLRRYADGARAAHYAPYSEFMVLAAVEAVDGKMYAGSNIEAVNYSLTKHAEEVAILAAIHDGQGPERPWLKTVYVAGGKPCGSCRQFAIEFAAADATWIIERVDRQILASGRLAEPDRRGCVERFSFDDLLPEAFRPEDVLG